MNRDSTPKPSALLLKLGTFGELLTMFADSGRWWLLPFAGILALTALLLLVVSVLEYAAPFIYTIF